MNEGKLIVISGPSGVGKGTALELAMKERPDLSFSVSATTRAPRPNEVEGVSYDFITVEQFRRMIDENAFLEYDNHNETYYGTPRAQLEEKRAKGPVFLDIDPMGAKRVRQAVPDAVLIFGSAATFGAAKKASAPGQMDVCSLDTVLRTLELACGQSGEQPVPSAIGKGGPRH